MKKYYATLKTSMQSVIAYRGGAVIWALVQLLELIFLLLIYNVLFSGRSELGGFTKTTMIAYFLMVNILNKLVMWFPVYKIEHDIRKGDLSNFLLKPYSYKLYVFFHECAYRIQYFIISIPFIVIFFWYIKNSFTISLGFRENILFLIYLIIGMSIFYLLSQLFGFVAFWFTRVLDFQNLFFVFVNILGGRSIPIHLLSGKLLGIAKILPTRYIFSMPLEIFFRRTSTNEAIKYLPLALLWVVALYVLGRIVWRKGIRKYEAYGQ